MNGTEVASRAVRRVLGVLPPELARQIEAVGRNRVGGVDSVREIRIRCPGASFVIFPSGSVRLDSRLSDEQVARIIRKITDGSLYAHADTIKRGYISMGDGIRVGVGGVARYDGGEPTVSNISSLVFRIPVRECEISEQLYSAYLDSAGGILIYSPPGVGKTTALRSLAGSISRRSCRRVVVVDERAEFDPAEFESCSVDLLSGYSRGRGIEIAVRTMSPEILMVDELMGDECREVEYSFLSGIPVIATAHAGSLSELLEKRELSGLISKGVFSSFIGISRVGGKYTVSVSKELDGCLSI